MNWRKLCCLVQKLALDVAVGIECQVMNGRDEELELNSTAQDSVAIIGGRDHLVQLRNALHGRHVDSQLKEWVGDEKLQQM